MQTNPSPPKNSKPFSIVIIAVSLACIAPFALGAIKKSGSGQPSVMQNQPDCTPTPTPTPPVE